MMVMSLLLFIVCYASRFSFIQNVFSFFFSSSSSSSSPSSSSCRFLHFPSFCPFDRYEIESSFVLTFFKAVIWCFVCDAKGKKMTGETTLAALTTPNFLNQLSIPMITNWSVRFPGPAIDTE
ncbi:hypothetical protein HOY80DRAFT_44101 [Tuber brumale]|nr:hypothetical protein HOY80DRAFT_44101 [Tuber brumale]